MKEDAYKKKKPIGPKQQVEFFDNPPTYGEIHHNHIFKFMENYAKYAVTNNKVSINTYGDQRDIHEDAAGIKCASAEFRDPFSLFLSKIWQFVNFMKYRN